MTADHRIIAYKVGPSALSIVPATANREWMTKTASSFANRCLPLRIANQFGWFILCSETVDAVWSGEDGLEALQIRCPNGKKPQHPISHFGHGILTWHIPFLFRTPPGYNLFVRGPTNWPKDGVVPLDGIVETDWAVATFTMNWKLTCVDTPVTFRKNEPICMITPFSRGQIESLFPEIWSLEESPELKHKYEEWSSSRDTFLKDLQAPTPLILWQKHYFKGTSPTNDGSDDHQRTVKLRPFVDHTTPAQLPEPILSGDPEDPLRIKRKAKFLWREVWDRITSPRS